MTDDGTSAPDEASSASDVSAAGTSAVVDDAPAEEAPPDEASPATRAGEGLRDEASPATGSTERPAALRLAGIHVRLGSLALARAELESLAGRGMLDEELHLAGLGELVLA